MTTPLSPGNETGSILRVSVIIPCVILIWSLVDLGARFIPPRAFAVRAWEALTLFATADGPFVPNSHYSTEGAKHDLANMANLTSGFEFLPETFTVDGYGFRNLPMAQPVRTLLIGDSFAAGSGVLDMETLSQRLGHLQGSPVYSAAGPGVPMETVCRLIADLRMPKGGLVILEISEHGFNQSAPRESHLAQILSSRFPAIRRRQLIARRYLSDCINYSPLKIEAGKAFRMLENDRVMPSTQKNNVIVKPLRNGQRMYFFRPEVENFYLAGSIDPAYIMELRRRLNALGQRLLVLIVPSKYTVYQPLIVDATPPPAGSRLYPDRLEALLRGNGFDTINLTGLFRRKAAGELAFGRYIYWIDDTHWRPEGIRIAAEEIWRHQQRLVDSQSGRLP